LWPGFGENSRVIKWAIEQIDGASTSVSTAIGLIPSQGALDISGLGITEEELTEVSAVNIDEWRMEVPLIDDWFAKIGQKLPTELSNEFEILKAALK
jgi:phosphoenolpyruvate carboxykinase (GTP)